MLHIYSAVLLDFCDLSGGASNNAGGKQYSTIKRGEQQFLVTIGNISFEIIPKYCEYGAYECYCKLIVHVIDSINVEMRCTRWYITIHSILAGLEQTWTVEFIDDGVTILAYMRWASDDTNITITDADEIGDAYATGRDYSINNFRDLILQYGNIRVAIICLVKVHIKYSMVFEASSISSSRLSDDIQSK